MDGEAICDQCGRVARWRRLRMSLIKSDSLPLEVELCSEQCLEDYLGLEAAEKLMEKAEAGGGE